METQKGCSKQHPGSARCVCVCVCKLASGVSHGQGCPLPSSEGDLVSGMGLGPNGSCSWGKCLRSGQSLTLTSSSSPGGPAEPLD